MRGIIHIGPPHTFDTYFQETGMAGRDDNKAKSMPFYNNNHIQSSLKDMDESIINKS